MGANMEVFLISHRLKGIGYARERGDYLEVRFWNSITDLLHYPKLSSEKGYLKIIGKFFGKEESFFT
tara:strand:+ start:2351 stop:2551 length:201 start_codon:yes stop_codon:yes gene_type:complete